MFTSLPITRLAKAIGLALALLALVVPVAQAAGSPQRSNPILRNDIAHFGNDAGVSAPASPVRPTSPAPVVVSVERGFDWASAGVGAAAGFGLLLALGGAATAMRARQRAQAQA